MAAAAAAAAAAAVVLDDEMEIALKTVVVAAPKIDK